jgi:hypothetical protein
VKTKRPPTLFKVNGLLYVEKGDGGLEGQESFSFLLLLP